MSDRPFHSSPSDGKATTPTSKTNPKSIADEDNESYRSGKKRPASSSSSPPSAVVVGRGDASTNVTPQSAIKKAKTTTGATIGSAGSHSTATTSSSRGGSASGPRASPTNSVTGEKSSSNRGLRHFSMMVCQKVEEKGTTTYNEVADELVKKVIADRRKEDPNGKFDEKNIRRRVYDALNVLMAMDIISKEKKEITWKGLPTAAKQNMDSMQKEIEFRRYQIDQKKEALRDLLVQQVCFRNLVLRNHERGVPEEKIPLPFIVVNTNSSAVIQCDMSRDRTDVMFDFSMPFEINDDNTILKKMGM